MPDSPKQTMTTAEAAKRLNVSVRTVQSRVDSGLLAATKTQGGHRRIERASVEAMANQEMGTPDAGKPSGARALNIILVDNSEYIFDLVSMCAAAWDFPVTMRFAKDCYNGLIQIGKETPHLAVIDLMTQGIDVFQIIRYLKSPDSGYTQMEIACMTAKPPKEVKAQDGLPEGVQICDKQYPFIELERVAQAAFERVFDPAAQEKIGRV